MFRVYALALLFGISLSNSTSIAAYSAPFDIKIGIEFYKCTPVMRDVNYRRSNRRNDKNRN